MEENIKRKLQLKYIFNTIRFKLYCGGYMKGFYSQKKKKKQHQQQQQQQQQKQKQKEQTNTTKNNF